MAHYEYKVVPAPKRGEKVRGLRAAEDRFAVALANVMNAQAAEGWEYQRTETLPAEEREGLMGKATVFQNMMVFRRTRAHVTDPVPPTPLIEDKRTEHSAAEETRDEATPAAPSRLADVHGAFRDPPLTAGDAAAQAAPPEAPDAEKP